MKYALITGGSRGIGRAICIRLASEGYYVLINFKSNQIEAEKTLYLIKEQNGNGELLQFDVADKEAIKNTLGKWIESNTDKNIEVLVNNAGIKDDGLMSWMSDEQWDNIITTNLDSFFYVTRTVLLQMLAKKIWPHHQCCFAFRFKRHGRTNKLCCCKGRCYRRYKIACAGSCSLQHNGKCSCARLYKNRYARRSR